MRVKRSLRWFSAAILVVVIIFAGIDQYMRWSTQPFVYKSVKDVPAKPTALVLGTTKYVGKRLNPFYMNRVLKTVALYRQGKIRHILVSGDRASRYYNEPQTMYNDLVKRGVPSNIIEVDNAGFRTLDSIEHAKMVFGQSHLIIISQRFHLARALFIARYFHLDSVGLIAADAPFDYYWRTRMREVPARVWAVVELYILRPWHAMFN
ncbi:vancomycin high temperature exclusion protein [Celerinatantimonas sp. MCCC 1A17872]|uniref:SanA/YdcF family protein n=1 Tax=Celerinatantimonas sp. MCCC 1A17872 TaxID=3177514 RepID=UPI0038CAEBDC